MHQLSIQKYRAYAQLAAKTELRRFARVVVEVAVEAAAVGAGAVAVLRSAVRGEVAPQGAHSSHRGAGAWLVYDGGHGMRRRLGAVLTAVRRSFRGSTPVGARSRPCTPCPAYKWTTRPTTKTTLSVTSLPETTLAEPALPETSLPKSTLAKTPLPETSLSMSSV